MRASFKSLSLIALTAAAGVALAGPVTAQERGPGMGRGMMNPERMVERAKERCEAVKARLESLDRDLSADQIRDIVEGRLAQSGNDNLKVGKVTAKGDAVVALDIVTKSGALVSSREISTKTGLPVGAETRCDQMVERISKAAASGDMPRFSRRGGAEGPMGGMMGGRMGGLGLMADSGPDRDINLTEANARTLAEAGLVLLGNPNLKVGAIKDTGDVFTVDIVAKDNSLVMQRAIDKQTGRPTRVK